MTESMKPNVEKSENKERDNLLKKNQERFRVISGQEVIQKTLNVLGGQEEVDLVKSGWEKQKNKAGFNETEFNALGGAENILRLEKLVNYFDEIKPIDQAEAGIIDPEEPEVDDRNEVVYKVVSGYEWENLSDDEKKLLGDESYVEMVRSGWKKQIETESTGGIKHGAELIALTGTKGAAGMEALVEDMKKLDNYENLLRENGEKVQELFNKREEVEKKYNLSQEDREILNLPEGSDEDEVPEVDNDWNDYDENGNLIEVDGEGKSEDGDNSEKDENKKEASSEDLKKFSRYLELASRISQEGEYMSDE
jgi:hypothetical protein